MTTMTRRTIARLTVGAVTVGLMAAITPAATAATPAAPTSAACITIRDYPRWLDAVRLDADEQRVIALINAYRVENGVPALRSDHKLMLAAGWASNDSAVRGFSPSDHIDTLGRDIGTRIQNCGYTGYGWASEINYNGPGATPEDAVHWWTRVSTNGHREAILDPRVKVFGVAVAIKDGKLHYTVNMGDKLTYLKLRPRR
ncbi:MAG TPA: CAP domain-containing protein [Pseudonocardia sp.]|nr:CAP domain-containing protein [Pseudonocardia sp.]